MTIWKKNQKVRLNQFTENKNPKVLRARHGRIMLFKNMMCVIVKIRRL